MSGRSPWPSPWYRLVEAALALAETDALDARKWGRAAWRLRRAALEYRDAKRGARGPVRRLASGDE